MIATKGHRELSTPNSNQHGSYQQTSSGLLDANRESKRGGGTHHMYNSLIKVQIHNHYMRIGEECIFWQIEFTAEDCVCEYANCQTLKSKAVRLNDDGRY